MSQTFPTPDFAHWSKMTSVTRAELAALLEWIDPIVVNGAGDGIENFVDLSEADAKITSAIASNHLTPINVNTGSMRSQAVFRANQIAAWAKAINHIKLSDLFDAQLKADPVPLPPLPVASATVATTPKDLAMEEAKRHFAQFDYAAGKSHKQQIREFLEQRFPNLSRQARENISSVLNPNPGGGRPPKIFL